MENVDIDIPDAIASAVALLKQLQEAGVEVGDRDVADALERQFEDFHPVTVAFGTAYLAHFLLHQYAEAIRAETPTDLLESISLHLSLLDRDNGHDD